MLTLWPSIAKAYRAKVLRMDSVATGSVVGDIGRSSASWEKLAGPGEISGHAEYSETEIVLGMRLRNTATSLRNCILNDDESK